MGRNQQAESAKADQARHVRPTEWRKRMEVEPTRDRDYCPADGCEREPPSRGEAKNLHFSAVPHSLLGFGKREPSHLL